MNAPQPNDEKKESRKKSSIPDKAYPWILTPRLWGITLILWIAMAMALPAISRRTTSRPDPERRSPFAASEDYWLFQWRADLSAAQGDVALLGDSVVWGYYVKNGDTIASALDAVTPGVKFSNLGVNGLHPAAMRGLLRYYGRSLSKGKVIVFCNLLWMSKPDSDLTTDEPINFNHSGLVPQFRPRLACYDAGNDLRISRSLIRYAEPLLWAQHLRIAYLGNTDLFRWTLDHPYACPSFRTPEEPEWAPGVKVVPWTQGGFRAGPMAFVEPDRSFQWRAFLDSLDLLKARGNDVLVVLLPFNEYMLTEPGLSKYRAFHQTAMETFRAKGFPAVAPAMPDSDLYGDSSHLLADGYRDLATELRNNPTVQNFLGICEICPAGE